MKGFSLHNSAALVTGSSKGIGQAIAAGLHAAGADVIYHGNASPAPAELPPGCVYLASDLTRETAPEELMTQAFAAKPSLNLLVCNAGSFFDVPYLKMGRQQWDRTMNLNVAPAYFLIQAFARELEHRSRPGSVVIVSSTNGFQSEDDSSAYDVSKGALVMMTRTLAQALSPLGIRVNGIAPGLIRTPLTHWLDSDIEKRRHYEKKILLARIGQPVDCAGPAVFLLSSAADYMTGQILVVDGGLTVGQIGRM